MQFKICNIQEKVFCDTCIALKADIQSKCLINRKK